MILENNLNIYQKNKLNRKKRKNYNNYSYKNKKKKLNGHLFPLKKIIMIQILFIWKNHYLNLEIFGIF